MRNTQEPPGGYQRPGPPIPPLAAAIAMGEFILSEHGREGVRRYVRAIAPFLPPDLLEPLARRMGVPVPPPPPPPPEPAPEPPPPPKSALPPEQMMLLMQALGNKGGGLDPKLLMQLMGKQG